MREGVGGGGEFRGLNVTYDGLCEVGSPPVGTDRVLSFAALLGAEEGSNDLLGANRILSRWGSLAEAKVGKERLEDGGHYDGCSVLRLMDLYMLLKTSVSLLVYDGICYKGEGWR